MSSVKILHFAFCILLYSYEVDAVAEGEDDTLYPAIVADVFIEGHNLGRLPILTSYLLHHLAVPQYVVRQDKGVAMHHIVVEEHIVVGTILPLVAIDKDKVVLLAQCRGYLEGRAYMLANLVGTATALEVVGSYHLQLVVYLEGVDEGTLLQSHSHRDCGVARKGAYLEDTARAEHTYKHLEELALYVARNHSWIDYTKVGFALQLV